MKAVSIHSEWGPSITSAHVLMPCCECAPKGSIAKGYLVRVGAWRADHFLLSTGAPFLARNSS